MSTPTPRTDASLMVATAANGHDYSVVDPEFARTLQLELAAAREEIEIMRKCVGDRYPNARQLEAHSKANRELAAAQRELAEARRWTDSDQAIPEDEAIVSAHPVNSAVANADAIYHEAIRMVSSKCSKYALVDLVNWLLARIAVLEATAQAQYAVTQAAVDIVRMVNGPDAYPITKLFSLVDRLEATLPSPLPEPSEHVRPKKDEVKP